MKTISLPVCLLLLSTFAYSQTGHIMQGVGAFNMSMGGASTGQPLDISGALQWNPASISAFNDKIIKFDIGMFYSSPELFSTVPEFNEIGQPTGNFYSGSTKDDRGVSPMPALAMVWGKEGSKHTFGASVFGISGFGVTFPESTTNPRSTAVARETDRSPSLRDCSSVAPKDYAPCGDRFPPQDKPEGLVLTEIPPMSPSQA